MCLSNKRIKEIICEFYFKEDFAKKVKELKNKDDQDLFIESYFRVIGQVGHTVVWIAITFIIIFVSLVTVLLGAFKYEHLCLFILISILIAVLFIGIVTWIIKRSNSSIKRNLDGLLEFLKERGNKKRKN